MDEVFVAELVVGERNPADRDELARPAIAWFGGPVELLSLEVNAIRDDGSGRYLLRGRFRAVNRGTAPAGQDRSRLLAAARWLGLVEDRRP